MKIQKFSVNQIQLTQIMVKLLFDSLSMFFFFFFVVLNLAGILRSGS